MIGLNQEKTENLRKEYKLLWQKYIGVSVLSDEAYELENKINPMLEEFAHRGIKPWGLEK